MTFFLLIGFYNIYGDKMKVKIFDLEDENDLENDVNNLLENISGEVIDIKYQVSCSIFGEEQVFCFSAMVIYYG